MRVEPAQDDERIQACSRALEAKYPGRSSTQAMLRREILDTTLELLPSQSRSLRIEPADLGLKAGVELDDIEGASRPTGWRAAKVIAAGHLR